MKFQQISVFLLILNKCLSHRNNVCKNFVDYLTIDFNNPNCWYNPDVFSTPEEVAENHGLQFQNYTVITQDGYYLNIFRVQDIFSSERKQPIILHHGIFATAMCFMVTGNHSLAFYLAKNGYDVWLANHRGNNYSPGHSYLNISDSQFWDFSFHEMGIYDVPAILEFISEETGFFNKIIYLGHSLGSMTGFVYASLRSDHAERYLKGFIGLSPVTFMKYAPTPFRSLTPLAEHIFDNLLQDNYTVLFPEPNEITAKLLWFCRKNILICMIYSNLINGEDDGELVAEDAMVALSYIPSRISIKTFIHCLQIINARRFQQYDYKLSKNLKIYNSSQPPIYPVSNIKIPVHLFYALNDNFASYEDVLSIYDELETAEKSLNLVPHDGQVKFNHLNFLIAKDIEPYVYKPLIKILRTLK